MQGLFADYAADPGVFCEMRDAALANGADARACFERLDRLSLEELRARAREAESQLYDLGVTFTVYSERTAIDRILPFDVIPRVIPPAEWAVIEAGVRQRVRTLNAFLADVYGPGRVLADGIVPADLVRSNPHFRALVEGFRPPHGSWVNICGVDLVRGPDGRFLVLEDNARTPSGVSYVVENRHLMQRSFADIMRDLPIRPVSDYGRRLHEALCEMAPEGVLDPQVVLLSPGVFNSAYFEHVFLAREMGVPLVEGRDLVVEDDRVYMKTIAGLERVDVVYRRVDDDFLDPEAFRPDSLLGVPGIVRALKAGTVAIANAIGTGVADDKAVYAYVPRLVRYYLDEEPILPNVETHICREPEALRYTLAHLDQLVVKPVGASGGYGITIGTRASKEELQACRARLLARPEEWIAQPVVELSEAPTLVEEGIAPRRVDLRPFVITGKASWVLPGGLTRVALRRGSLVVNSSQGGGSKDTWVLAERRFGATRPAGPGGRP